MGSRVLFSISLNAPDETAILAKSLAPACVPGDVLLLAGDVGSGKTHFARAFIQERLFKTGLFEDIPSPTYTLVQTYSDGIAEIWHADVYRLTDPPKVLEFGLSDAFQDEICLVEWPEQLMGFKQNRAICMNLKPGDTPDSRQLTIEMNPCQQPGIASFLKDLSGV